MDGVMYSTIYENGKPLEKKSALMFTPEVQEECPVENHVMNLYPQICYQTIHGFGGAMTESAGYAISLLSDEERRTALEAYFGHGGIGYRYIRTHIDSCDFSLNQYTAAPDVTRDPEFSDFSIDRDRRYIIPAIKQAMEICPEPLSVLLSPWSPPAEWKTPPSNTVIGANVYKDALSGPDRKQSRCGTRSWGGHLRPEHYADWARYVVMYVKAYLDEDIPVTMVTVQNEAMAATPWDSCQWTAREEQIYLRDYLYPELEKAGLAQKIGIYIWDHNKERVFERSSDILDETTRKLVEGVAFHWYSGDHFEAVGLTHEVFPEKCLMFSEGCAELSKYSGAEDLTFGQKYAHDIIGNLNAGMNTFLDWNLFLDEKGGPNHVGNFCAAPVMLDGKGSFKKHFSWYYIGHFSRSILPGARRIALSRYTDAIEATAVQNPDGTLTVVMLNRTDKQLPLNIRLNGMLCRLLVPASSISTATIGY